MNHVQDIWKAITKSSFRKLSSEVQDVAYLAEQLLHIHEAFGSIPNKI